MPTICGSASTTSTLFTTRIVGAPKRAGAVASTRSLRTRSGNGPIAAGWTLGWGAGTLAMGPAVPLLEPLLDLWRDAALREAALHPVAAPSAPAPAARPQRPEEQDDHQDREEEAEAEERVVVVHGAVGCRRRGDVGGHAGAVRDVGRKRGDRRRDEH